MPTLAGEAGFMTQTVIRLLLINPVTFANKWGCIVERAVWTA